jgi:hypothetical protein
LPTNQKAVTVYTQINHNADFSILTRIALESADCGAIMKNDPSGGSH